MTKKLKFAYFLFAGIALALSIYFMNAEVYHKNFRIQINSTQKAVGQKQLLDHIKNLESLAKSELPKNISLKVNPIKRTYLVDLDFTSTVDEEFENKSREFLIN